MKRNPFKPSAGVNPPLLVGREQVLTDFQQGLFNGAGDPYRLLRVTGNRGAGKTVLLNALGEYAAQNKWQVIHETATTGLVVRLIRALHKKTGRYVKSVTLPGISIDGLAAANLGGLELSDPLLPATLREAFNIQLDAVTKKHPERGILLTIDEVQGADPAELRTIATTTQHLIRENHNIAVVFAGLPGMDSTLLHDNVITFLRRATPVVLKDIPLELVKDSFVRVFGEHDRTLTPRALEAATKATKGYPFMIQLVGYYVWNRAGDNALVEIDHAEQGVDAAMIRLGETVHEPAVEDLSAVDRTFLLAMAQDTGPSRMKDICQRINRNGQYANQYRQRLIDSGVIEESGYGYVDFTIPYLRDWLKDHQASVRLRDLK